MLYQLEMAFEQADEPPGTMLLASTTATQERKRTENRTKSRLRFPPSNPLTLAFRQRYFPEISDTTWNDWQWQMRHRIRTLEQLRMMLCLSPDEEAFFQSEDFKLPAGITPYYMSLLSREDPMHPLRRCVVPTIHEFHREESEADDPLHEEQDSPVEGLVHRYPDRVLLLSHYYCSTYCRYCTRSRIVGHGGSVRANHERLQRAIDYIRVHSEIRDVLISGGDPLLLSMERLQWLLGQIRAIPHVEILRIGTKVPAVLPQRITPELVDILRKYHPLWMSLHFTHPEECTPEAYHACGMLADAGIPLGSQTVLLRGVNDSVETMRKLVHHLLRMRVRPYYLYQCDPITGSAHFRTPVEKGIEIIRGLRGHTTGYAVPTYVIDAPGGGGKIPLMPEYVVGRDGDDLLLRNFEGGIYRYPDADIPPSA